jgi:hypothetical protein
MSRPDLPRLAVVLPTDGLETIQKTLAALRRQSIVEALELVVVVPPGTSIEPSDVGREFHSVRIDECAGPGEADWFPRARATGALRASAPVVALGETHSYPEPEWAVALLAAHREPYAAVGFLMRNANPKSVISRANLFVDFAPWVERRERGTMDELPGHNTSYKLTVLQERSERLAEWLASETLLAEDLRAAGHHLLYEPAAVTRHVNLGSAFWFLQRFDHDRAWSVLRCRDWSPARRALYVLGAPLIPFVRFSRIYPELRRAGHGGDLLLAVTVLLGLGAGALGEAVGYVSRRGGGAGHRLHQVEMHRERFAGSREQVPDLQRRASPP